MSELYRVFSIFGAIAVFVILLIGVIVAILMGKKNLSFPDEERQRKGYLVCGSIGVLAYLAAIALFAVGAIKMVNNLPFFSSGEADSFYYGLFWGSFLYHFLSFCSFLLFLAALVGTARFARKND